MCYFSTVNILNVIIQDLCVKPWLILFKEGFVVLIKNNKKVLSDYVSIVWSRYVQMYVNSYTHISILNSVFMYV